ncbi:MAG: hypothetical protein GEU88_15360 [Solirubrobacterales bacterium]|nr:hypothetical protein [Solirubrobacterales bacterium]
MRARAIGGLLALCAAASAAGCGETEVPAPAPQASRSIEAAGSAGVPASAVELHEGATVRDERALIAAAERFSRSLVAYLYSPGRERWVAATDGSLARALRRSPPFVPRELRGQPARVSAVEVYPQLPRRALVRVGILDQRSGWELVAVFGHSKRGWEASDLAND